MKALLSSRPVLWFLFPFVAALAELVALQADRFHGHGRFVVLRERADIQDRHFPAADS
ncbi:hypothetical protein [Nonomuraea sp. NPDC003709]|uniref:hypothetical protein n=1 Tax=Nonomuraea sp. NPDC003709 TaxID=3154450 RepID=UPI0033A8920A